MASITQLKYALALGKAEHFAKAASMCHVTQPAVSKGIIDLEGELGYSVFIRGGNQYIKRFAGITPEGKQFLDKAAKVVADFDDLMKGK